MSFLKQKNCSACKSTDKPFTESEISKYKPLLHPDWKVIDLHHIERSFKFKDFKEALDFVNKIGFIAEAEGHHPDLSLSWGKVGVILFTHKIKGLSLNDFILAAKIDALS